MNVEKKYNILAVDDEIDALEMFEDSFRRDYNVFCAHSGNQAIQILKDHDIQLVFSDQRMPGISGIELLEKVKNEKPDAVRILTTGVTDLQTAIDSINRGNIHRYIPKPWNEDELRTVVADQLRIRALDEENKRLQEDYAREKLRAGVKEEILQTVSHEFRTPLTTIIGYMELLEDGHFGSLGEEQQTIIDVVFQSGLYLRQILENILLLSKIKTESVPLQLEDINVNDVLEDVVTSLQVMAAKKNLRLTLEKTDLPTILADRSKLKEVFFNLIHNGLKFTAAGLVTITTHTDGDDIVVQVTDTGSGISDEEQKQIFNKFKQTGDFEESLKGLGLGLSIADGLVKLHQGTISVTSTPGQGSSFSVRLPVLLPSS